MNKYIQLININKQYIKDLTEEVEIIRNNYRNYEQKERIFLMLLRENMLWSILRYKQEIEEYKLNLILYEST